MKNTRNGRKTSIQEERNENENTRTAFRKIATLIKEEFVAIYREKDNALEMRIPCGQKFLITVQEILG